MCLLCINKMFCKRFSILLNKKSRFPNYNFQQRKLQVSIIGAASQIGSNLALMLIQNPKVTSLNLYDDDEKVKGIGLELSYIFENVKVATFSGHTSLPTAVRHSKLIMMVSRTPREPGTTRDQMLAANAPAVQRLCRVVADQNPEAFLAVSTSPINAVVPLISALMFHYGTYNPCKICGITHIDTARCRTLVGNALRVNPSLIYVPVIGGHSEDTIVPLFSNISPCSYSLDSLKAETLTRILRKAGTEVLKKKYGHESAVLCMAWSLNEFADKLLEGLYGYETVVNCFSANPHYGTRFFGGPASVGSQGLIRVCGNLPLSEYESTLLNRTIPILNKEVCSGENFMHTIDSAGKLK